MGLRIVAGFLAFLFGLRFVAGLAEGDISLLMAIGCILLGGTFLIYTVGGPKLLKRILPLLQEKL